MQTVKDKENSTLLVTSDHTYWVNKRTGITLHMDTQTVAPDSLMTIRLEPRRKYFKRNGRHRLKTSLGIVKSRMATKSNPLKGPTATGLRLEQRVRISSGSKAVGTAVRFVGKSSGGSKEIGTACSLETSFKPASSIEGREFMVGWNTMGTQRLAQSGRVLSSNRTHGGTLACQQHWGRDTTVSARTTMSSQQSTLTLHITSLDKMFLRWSFVLPVVGWIWDKLRGRGADDL